MYRDGDRVMRIVGSSGGRFGKVISHRIVGYRPCTDKPEFEEADYRYVVAWDPYFTPTGRVVTGRMSEVRADQIRADVYDEHWGDVR